MLPLSKFATHSLLHHCLFIEIKLLLLFTSFTFNSKQMLTPEEIDKVEKKESEVRKLQYQEATMSWDDW